MMKRRHDLTVPSILAFVVLMLMAASPTANAEEPPSALDFARWRSYNNTGLIAFDRGDYNTAELRFIAAIKHLREHDPSNQRLLARSYFDLARTLYAQRRYAEAQPLAEWVLRVRERDADAEPGVLIDSLHLLGLIHREREHDAEAEALLRQAVEIEELTLIPGDPQVNLAQLVEELAGVQVLLRKYEAADANYLWVISIRKRYGPNLNLALANAIEGRARVLEQLGRESEARAADAEAKRIRDAALSLNARLKAVREGRATFVPGGQIQPAPATP